MRIIGVKFEQVQLYAYINQKGEEAIQEWLVKMFLEHLQRCAHEQGKRREKSKWLLVHSAMVGPNFRP